MKPGQFHTRIALLSAFILSLPALGQRPSRSGIGLKAGPMLSTMHAEGASYDPLLGASVGGYFPIWIGNRFEIQPELIFSLQGATYNLKESGTATLRLTYMQIPLLGKVFITNALNFQAGAQFSYLVSASASVDGESQDATDQFNSQEFGTLIGLGYDLRTGLDFTFRYFTGITPIRDDLGQIVPTNRFMQLTVGYRFLKFGKVRRSGRRRG